MSTNWQNGILEMKVSLEYLLFIKKLVKKQIIYSNTSK